MKDFDQINRRTHLYLGLFLVPWLLMYGVSSFLIGHHSWFRSDQPPSWQLLFDREYQRPISDQIDLREVAAPQITYGRLSNAPAKAPSPKTSLWTCSARFLDC